MVSLCHVSMSHVSLCVMPGEPLLVMSRLSW